jgi:hypothetical protein
MIKLVIMGILKFINGGGVKNIQRIATLIKLSKAAKLVTAGGTVATLATVESDPETALTSLLVTLVAALSDWLISYIKGRENKK